jgi:hypothetical protein
VPGSASFASVEQNGLQFISHTLRPILEKIEWSYSKLLPNPSAFIKFNFNALLRGDLQTRMTSYSIGTQAGFMSVNDVRRLEDLPPVADGDQFRVPLANIDLAQTSVIEDEKRVKMAHGLRRAWEKLCAHVNPWIFTKPWSVCIACAVYKLIILKFYVITDGAAWHPINIMREKRLPIDYGAKRYIF